MQMLRLACYGGHVVPVNPRGGTTIQLPGGDIDRDGPLPDNAARFATMESAGAPMFNGVEEMAESAGLLATYSILREQAKRDTLPTVFFRDRGGL